MTHRRGEVPSSRKLAACAAGLLVLTAACSPDAMLHRFSSPADQATALRYIALLRAGEVEAIERALDPEIGSSMPPGTLERMAAAIPKREPAAVKLVGAQRSGAPGVVMINTTFEYDFGDTWLLINVAVRQTPGDTTIVGFNVVPQPGPLETQNRFTLSDKGAVHYVFLGAGVLAVLLTLYALVSCITASLRGRKWPWILFILFGVGRVWLNWSTGLWGVDPLAVQVFSASAFAPLHGPWTVAVSFPLGAIVFLALRTRLSGPGAGSPTPEAGGPPVDDPHEALS